MNLSGPTSYLSGRQVPLEQLGYIRLLDGNNVSIGISAGENVQSGTENVFCGYTAGANAVSNTSVFVGSRTGSDASHITSSVIQGYRAGERAEYITNSVYIGPYTGQQAIRSSDTVLVGYQAGANLTSGSRNVILGSYAGFSQYNGFDNVIIGHRAGYFNKLGSNNVYVGTHSGWAATDAVENVCLGVASGERLVSGRKNVLSGFRAGANIRNASNCIAMGTRAMEFFYNGDTNTCLGTEVARRFTGNNNTIIGGYSTANALGSFNTIIGSRSMNRQTLEQVNLSNCVVVGENIQFDIPVRPVSANIELFDTVPDAYLNAQDDTVVWFQDANESYNSTSASLTMNIVPVGDPMVVRERYFSFGTLDQPCVLDTSEDGSYRIRWGSAVSDTNELLDVVPVDVTLERVGETLSVRAVVYGQLESEWDIEALDEHAVCIEQTFDPPSLTVTIDGETTDITASLPGTRLDLNPFGQQTSPQLYTVFTSSDASGLVAGQEVQLVNSAISSLNKVVRIDAVGPDPNDPSAWYITLRTGPVGSSNLGQSAILLPSRVVSVSDVEGEVVNGGVACTVPSFSSFLVGTLTDPLVYIEGDGDQAGGVYAVDVVDAVSGECVILDATEVSLGTLTVGTLEPLIIGLDVSTSGPSKSIGSFGVVYNQRADSGLQTKTFEGPYVFDGHVHVGAGTQDEMDVSIRSNVITFYPDGYSAAEYTIGALNSDISIGSVFQLDYDNVNFGVQWLNTYSVTCVTDGTWFECRVTYDLGSEITLANVSTDGIDMGGQLTVYTLTRETVDDVYQLVETEYPLFIGEGGVSDQIPDTAEIRVIHDLKRKTLRVEVLVYTGLKTLVLFMDFTEVRPPNRGSRSLRYFADGPLLLTSARYTNSFYADYPSFSDCIFIGSNFTVGGDAALEERSNVCIAEIGTQRLFRGRTELMEFFSDRVQVPTLVGGNVTGGGDGYVAAVYRAPDGSDETVYVEGLSNLESVNIRQDTTMEGDLQCDGSVQVGGDMDVVGDVRVQGLVSGLTLEIEDTAAIGGDVTVAGSSQVHDLSVDGDLSVTGDGLVEGGFRVDGELQCHSLSVDTNTAIGGHCEIEQTLTVSGAADLDSLSVTNNVTVDGQMTVDGRISTDTDVFIEGSSVSGTLESLDNRIDDVVSDVNDLNTDVSTLQGQVNGLDNDLDALSSRLYNDADGDIPELNASVNNLDDSKYDKSGGTIDGSVNINGSLSVGSVNDSGQTKVAVWDGSLLKKYVGTFVTDTSLFNALNGYVSTSGGDTIGGSLTVSGDLTGGRLFSNDTGGSGGPVVITQGKRICAEQSSARYKENIHHMPEVMTDAFWKLKPKLFTYTGSPALQAGFIAEEVHETGYTFGVQYDELGRPDALRHTPLLAITVAAVQQLAARVADLEKKIS